MSAPPPGASGQGSEMRASTPRRRLLEPGDGLSPKAKRPAAYMQPLPTPVGQQMDAVTMTNEILQTKAAVQQMHQWLTSVAEAVVDHAGIT